MLVNLRNALVNPLTLIGIVLFVISFGLGQQSGYTYYLTSAQLLFIPTLLQLVVSLSKLDKSILALGMVGVTALQFDVPSSFELVCAIVYLIGTLVIANRGVERFLNRGFTNTAEIMIDLGLIYIAIGGLWFLAYVGGFETGFSPLTNWLTAIHFHYSAFMLCISVGLMGRIRMSKLYKLCALIIATGPMTVAIGITFSYTVEILSVSLYVVAIYTLTFYAFRLKLPPVQAFLVRLSFLTLCLTILGSFLYAFGNFTRTTIVTIPDMLAFHGLLNCLVFGFFTVIGWSLSTPSTSQRPYRFPVSRIRGKLQETGAAHPGLVDDLSNYVDVQNIPPLIKCFYERTENFQLLASVKWATWFKPLAFIYQFISRRMGQLNLPYSQTQIEMTGDILLVDEQLDGRDKPRVWRRRIGAETVFVAIYSKHETDGMTFMNIALPLPFSTMHGILELTAKKEQLHLTSKGNGDAGTYLAIGRNVFKLPLHEYFLIKEDNGSLQATHNMTLFGIHFLHIEYVITEKTNNRAKPVL